ncbi:phosphomevalonate kinase [Streptomyces sp. NPDC058486]|uniref:phosphomevalonate kinase n=1 Tax=unclassified Streptomyces TaxID=2593676 RepID=UPI0036588928
MSSRTVTRRAPGKLFIAGEYAVTEPGRHAVLMAVDRYVTVTVSGLPVDAAGCPADIVVVSDLSPEPLRLRRAGGGLQGCDPPDEQRAATELAHVVSAIETVDQWWRQRRFPRPRVLVCVTSTLHDNGLKLGLGSSGAVTVATVAALAAYEGRNLPPETQYRLAILAQAKLDPLGSGGDVAASAFGGWIAYQAPDRAAVLQIARGHGIDRALRTQWPGLAINRLPPPSGATLQVGWTRDAASTAAVLSSLRTREWGGSPSHRTFLADSDACARGTATALRMRDPRLLVEWVRIARLVLTGLDQELGLGIFTDALTALCEAAEEAGGAGKPSGAGGGDCGIALIPARNELARTRLHSRWSRAGITRLSVNTAEWRGLT